MWGQASGVGVEVDVRNGCKPVAAPFNAMRLSRAHPPWVFGPTAIKKPFVLCRYWNACRANDALAKAGGRHLKRHPCEDDSRLVSFIDSARINEFWVNLGWPLFFVLHSAHLCTRRGEPL